MPKINVSRCRPVFAKKFQVFENCFALFWFIWIFLFELCDSSIHAVLFYQGLQWGGNITITQRDPHPPRNRLQQDRLQNLAELQRFSIAGTRSFGLKLQSFAPRQRHISPDSQVFGQPTHFWWIKLWGGLDPPTPWQVPKISKKSKKITDAVHQKDTKEFSPSFFLDIWVCFHIWTVQESHTWTFFAFGSPISFNISL